MNQLIYEAAVWLDNTEWSTRIHESYYLYNWIESTHVLTLMLSLGILFLIDMRMLGWAFADISANKLATRLNVPMLLGFVVMFGTGILLFYAVPVRSAQSIWFRVKIGLLIVCAINAFMFHRKMTASIGAWDSEPCAPKALRLGALVSLVTWSVIVICGRFIAYDWFDCSYPQSDFIRQIAGCIDGQTQF